MINNKLSIITFLFIVFLLTILDICVVETVYRPLGRWDVIWQYHYLYWSLIIILPILTSILLKNIILIATWIFFIFGLEDTLFYILQGYLPKIYYGVTICGIYEPKVSQVLMFNNIGIFLMLVYFLFVVKLNNRNFY